jgi:hypothetical protein
MEDRKVVAYSKEFDGNVLGLDYMNQGLCPLEYQKRR